jgi:putative Ca2+/H+ antiporter (TMEM165/GDT1 family)
MAACSAPAAQRAPPSHPPFRFPRPHPRPQIFFNAFILTFLAEWGDRSQIATIGLAASQDVVGVTVGSIIGHAGCTAAAVLGGRHLAAHINERTVGVSPRRGRGKRALPGGQRRASRPQRPRARAAPHGPRALPLPRPQFVGGFMFLVFGLHSLYEGPQ